MLHHRRSVIWLLFLVLSFCLMSGVPEYGMVVPLGLLGFVWRPAWVVASHLNRWVFATVLWLQPWFRGQWQVQVPTAGSLTVSNHRSHLDAFMVMAAITPVRLVAKSTLLWMPPFGPMLWFLQMIPIRRKSVDSYWRAMEKVRRGLRCGDRVHIFAEMTRCQPGALETGRFHLAPFKVAREENVPVVPTVFWGTDLAWPRNSVAIGFRRFCFMKTLEPLQPNDFPSAEALAQEAKARIDREVQFLSQQYPYDY